MTTPDSRAEEQRTRTYEAAMQRFFSHAPFKFEWVEGHPPSRDELHDRTQDSLKVEGDVMKPAPEEWSALSGDENHLYTRQAGKPFRKN